MSEPQLTATDGDGGEPVRRLPRGARIADITVCVLLFVAQGGLGLLALMSFMVFPMSTDNCAYEACGDGNWINWAMWMALGSIVPAGLFFSLGVIQLARRRIAFWLPLLGVLAQVGLLLGAWRVADLAGPIAG